MFVYVPANQLDFWSLKFCQHLWCRCSRYRHAVWCIFNITSISCYPNIWSFYMVFSCFICCLLFLYVCPFTSDYYFRMFNSLIYCGTFGIVFFLLCIITPSLIISNKLVKIDTLVFSKALQDGSSSAAFRIYIFMIGIYAAYNLFIGFLVRIPFCHRLTDLCYHWRIVRLVRWLHQVIFFHAFSSVFEL